MKFDASLFVVVAIFGVAYVVLKLALFDPLLRILQRRERRIEEARSLWQQATARADEALTTERQRLLVARRDAAARREAARRAALDERRKALAEVEGETRQVLDAARESLAAEAEKERHALAARAKTLAARISERLVGRAV